MRVAINAHLLSFTGNYRQAGLSRYIYELVTRAPSSSPDDSFVAFTGSEPIPPAFEAHKPSNLRIVHGRLSTSRAPLRILWEQTALPFSMLTARVDLLHCPVNVRPLWCPVPVVITIHDLIFMRYPKAFNPLKRLYLTVMTRFSARRAARVITVSEATRQDVLAFLQVPAKRVVTVHNGVGEEFRPAPPAVVESFRRDKGLTGRTLLYLGTLEPRKNVETALRAFRHIATDPNLSDVTFCIGGSKGWYYDTIFEEAERDGLVESGRVRFLGRVPDEELPLWYNSAALFVYPSRYEGFGLPALEAMACGTPTAVSTTTALQEVAGDAALRIDPDYERGWSDAMRAILTRPELAEEYRRKGLSRAEEFSWSRCARETLNVYRQVARRRRKRGESPR